MRGNTEVIDLRRYRATELTVPADEDPQSLPSGTTLLLGQYRITGYLDCGGFGITYLAEDCLGRTVVVKECFPSELCVRVGKAVAPRSPRYATELASIILDFIGEARHLAAIRHPNVVHVHQVFEENATAYIVMDFIEGPDLLDILTQEPERLSPRDIAGLTRAMLGALRYLHRQGVLHRDVSPDNILIGRDGAPVLIDFGAAREHGDGAGQVHSKLKVVKDGYSPHEFYMTGTEQGTWSDLYSLAATLYHVITRVPPVDAQTRIVALAARKPDPYVQLAGTVAGYPNRFLRAIDIALEILPERRIQTAEEWLAIIAPRTPAAKPESRSEAVGADRAGIGGFLKGDVRAAIVSTLANAVRRAGRSDVTAP